MECRLLQQLYLVIFLTYLQPFISSQLNHMPAVFHPCFLHHPISEISLQEGTILISQALALTSPLQAGVLCIGQCETSDLTSKVASVYYTNVCVETDAATYWQSLA